MSRPTCAGSDIEQHCERAVARYREGRGYCLFHPDSEPPVMDPRTGKPVNPTPLVKAVKTPKHLEPPTYPAPARVVADEAGSDDGMLDLQAELDELERTDPVVAEAAASYAAAVDRVLTTPPQETPDKAEPTVSVPSTDLLTLQVCWTVVARIAGDDTARPAARYVAREARRTLGTLIDELRPANGAPVTSPTNPLTCKHGCGKTFAAAQGRTMHERYCKEPAA